MAVKSKTQLAADIAASTFTAPQQVILDDMVDSYQDLSQGLTTVQIAAIASPTSGQLVYNTDLSQFQYYNGTQWVNLANGLGVPQTVKVTISAAQLAALATTPIDLIAAQGAGLVICPILITGKYQYGTTAYDFATGLYIAFSTILSQTVSLCNIGTSSINAANDVSGSLVAGSSFSTQDRLIANDKLQLSAATNPTTGDGVLELSITYITIPF
jgi:hypothetical protein